MTVPRTTPLDQEYATGAVAPVNASAPVGEGSVKPDGESSNRSFLGSNANPRTTPPTSLFSVEERERWESVWATYIDPAKVCVQTMLRPSSALGDFGRYYETTAMAYERGGGLLWQSAAHSLTGARIHHNLAVRWFTRKVAS